MSTARQCDLCEAFFKPAPGCVTLESFLVDTDHKGTAQGWSEVEFCPECSAKVLALVKPALDDFDDPREPEDRDGQ